jgi:hypothetical protein
VVFACPSADPTAYAKYGATLIASVGIHASEYVTKLARQGIGTTGTVWCLAATSHDLHAYPGLAEATARDIEGKPLAVPWIPVSVYSETPTYFGCVNHPAFRAHMRLKVCDAMAGGPVSLSANVCLPAIEHTVVAPFLTYCASEVAHFGAEGAKGLVNAVKAYRMAEALGRPMASAGTSQDWAFIKEHNAEQLVCLWIALAYACGQCFMLPNRVLCSMQSGAPQWYIGPSEVFAPLYAFIRKQSGLLNDFKAIGPMAAPSALPQSFYTHDNRLALAATLNAPPGEPLRAGLNTWVFPRIKNDGSVAIHIVNLAYNVRTKSVASQENLEIRFSNTLFNRIFSSATVYGFNERPIKVQVKNEGESSSFVLPKLRLWSIVTFEYWA